MIAVACVRPDQTGVGSGGRAVTAISIEQVLLEEAIAIHGPEGPEIETLRNLAGAQAAESLRARRDADTRTGGGEKLIDVERRKAFYRALNRLDGVALCCSGGGIRSATFCLGVIQALAMYRPATSAAATGPSAGTTDNQTEATPAAVVEKQTEA